MLCDSAFDTRSISDLSHSPRDICQTYIRDPSDANVQVLGATLIREYMRDKNVVGMMIMMPDNVYGANQVQRLKNDDVQRLGNDPHYQSSTLINADSYANFAMDLYWSQHCINPTVRTQPVPGQPRILNPLFTNEERRKIDNGIKDAIDIINFLLVGSENDRELFMRVYEKYFPKAGNGEPDNTVIGWSSLSYLGISRGSSLSLT